MSPYITKFSSFINDNIRPWLKSVLIVAGVFIVSVFVYLATAPAELSFIGGFSGSTVVPNLNISALDPKSDAKLDGILKKAAMQDKTVILTTINSAWASSAVDLFLQGFRNGIGTAKLLEHLILVCLDKESLDACNHLHPNCFQLSTEGVDFSGSKTYMSEGYLLMMWRRMEFLLIVLQKGYNFVFTDGDIVWFRNPFDQFYRDADFQIACDNYYGDPTSIKNRPNCGFKYVKANEQSVAFYKYWLASKEKYTGQNEQDVLNHIKYDGYIRKIGLDMRFLNTEYFGGFCEPSMDLNKVYTMHANCCTKLNSKLHDMKAMLDDWKRYLSMSEDRKKSRPWSWSLLQYSCLN